MMKDEITESGKEQWREKIKHADEIRSGSITNISNILTFFTFILNV